MSSKFYDEIKDTKLEREVELVYKKEINIYFKDSPIRHPSNCDGYIEQKIKYKEIDEVAIVSNTSQDAVKYSDLGKVLRLIMEFKFDEKFDSKVQRCKVLIQVLYYLKSFELKGEILPNVILVGDKDETFVLHSNDINAYLSENIDWSIAPSEAHNKNGDLIIKMANDSKINPFIFSIDKNFSFESVAKKIKQLALEVQRTVRITEQNISIIYDYFISKVIKNSSKIKANRLVFIFIELMINPIENYKIPTRKNKLKMSDGTLVDINGDVYESFFSYFERTYKPEEKEKFTEIQDRLIEDTTRRYKGEYYTPTLWVDEAHKIITKKFGDKWKEKYVVWDCAWGTGNLTRDYRFQELYCSTLNKEDIEIGKRYNIRGATKFQYDFLNDDTEILEEKFLLEESLKMPKELLIALKENKPIIFLINPPYGTGSNAGNKKGDHKKGIAKTKINKIMLEDKIGAASQQLYTQFLYRILLMKKIYNLTNINICIYAKSTYLTGTSFDKFRKEFLKEFKYEYGMLFQGSNFTGVKGSWGIDFSIWCNGETTNKNDFIHSIKEVGKNNEIIKCSSKRIYNLDGRITGSDWIKQELKGKKKIDVPQFSSGIIYTDDGGGNSVKGSMGYYYNKSNSVYKNSGEVYIVSGTSSDAHGTSIIEENFKKVASNFTARRLISSKYANWVNDKDEYLVPNINHSKYEEWNNEAIVYMIFNTANNITSLRNINYKNKLWDIQNELFFMSVKEIKELSNKYENDEIYNDTKEFGNERYIYKLLNKTKLSDEGQAVLDKARELVEKSFKYRDIFNEENPKYQINNWDASWYQVKEILKLYMKEELKEFSEVYKLLENKIRPMVYELKFLIQ